MDDPIKKLIAGLLLGTAAPRMVQPPSPPVVPDRMDYAQSNENQDRRDYIAEALRANAQGQQGITDYTTRKMARKRASQVNVMPTGTPGPHRVAGADSTAHLIANGKSTGDPDWDWIIRHESGFKTTAKNPKSSAFGLGQLIRGNRESYGRRLGIDPDTIDYNEQLKMMDLYIKERYGTPAKAKAFWEKNGWY